MNIEELQQSVSPHPAQYNEIERRQERMRRDILTIGIGKPEGKFTLAMIVETCKLNAQQRHRAWKEIQRLIRWGKVRRLEETINRGIAYQVVK